MYGLSPNQMHYLALLYTQDNAVLYEAIENLERHGKVLVTRVDVGQLYDAEFIDTTWKSSSTYPDDPELTESGKKLVRTVYNLTKDVKVTKNKDNDIIKYGAELSDAYPTFWDRIYQAQSFKVAYDKNIRKIEGRAELYSYYYEIIGGDLELHKEIIKKIEWAKKMNAPDNTIPKVPEIRQSIINFVILKAWESIKMSGSSDKVKGI